LYGIDIIKNFSTNFEIYSHSIYISLYIYIDSDLKRITIV